MTVSQWLTDALAALGVVGADDTPAPADFQLAFRTANRLIGAWATNRLLIYAIQRQTWTITTAASYSVGTGQTINVPRPSNMNGNGANVQFIDTSQNPNIELPLTMLTDDTYQAIVQKTYESNYPNAWYYQPTNATTGTLIFWPIPTSGTLIGVIYAPRAVQQVAITDTLSVPPEWDRFMVTNLAMELAMYFPAIRPSNELQAAAKESKGDVERVNTRLVDLSVDLALQPMRICENFYSGGQR